MKLKHIKQWYCRNFITIIFPYQHIVLCYKLLIFCVLTLQTYTMDMSVFTEYTVKVMKVGN